MTNKLILGDNLEILKGIESETIDLIYLDPPFFSNRNYEVIWGDAGEVRSFQDRWSGGMEHYIAWLYERVEQMHRILKPSGSIFLHCDWHANAEIKVFILNKLFGENNFKGEIVWQRTNSHNDAKNKLAVLKDTIWYYSKSEKFTYNPVYGELTEKYINDFYKLDDNDGKGLYRLDNMASPNPRPNMMYEWKGFSYPQKGWRYEKETMQKLDNEGKIYYPKDKNGNFDYSKRLALKRYLNEQKGQLLGDLWTDIQNVQAVSKEKIGYPTQKPEALLQRIIEMASNEGDVVLDPFVGGGTTVAVADRLNRRWIGIDQSVQAVKVTELRLDRQRTLFSVMFSVVLHKYDRDKLFTQNPFEFETFIIGQFGGVPQNKRGGDKGIDGKMPDGTPIQVKQQENVGRNVIDNFKSAVQRLNQGIAGQARNDGGETGGDKPFGYIIAFSFGKGAIQEVARLKLEEKIVIELVTVDKIVPLAKKPTISITIDELRITEKQEHEVRFTAKGESEAGIEFYSWDFHLSPDPSPQGRGEGFRADIMLDREGVQTVKLKAGQHTVAVKVVDNDGLENIEVIRLKVNGKVETI